MTLPSPDIYRSARLAAGYAFSRPPVHPRIVERLARRAWFQGRQVRRALDVGCGAGLSTAALAPLAGMTVGIEPAAAMLTHRGRVAPDARFVVGVAERLPFAAGAFDLVTAAGALNYADRSRALPEIARVLSTDGLLVIYDFSSGRRFRDNAALGAWFEAFSERYPFPPGYAVDVQGLDYASSGLRLASYEDLEVAVALTPDAYLAYVLSEANVETAVTMGADEAEVTDWCCRTLAPVFGAAARDILFSSYIACVIKS